MRWLRQLAVAAGLTAGLVLLGFRAGCWVGRMVLPFDPAGPGAAVGLVFDGARGF